MLAQGSCWQGGGHGEGQTGPTAAERGNCRLHGPSTLTWCWEIKALEPGQMGPIPTPPTISCVPGEQPHLLESHSGSSFVEIVGNRGMVMRKRNGEHEYYKALTQCLRHSELTVSQSKGRKNKAQTKAGLSSTLS